MEKRKLTLEILVNQESDDWHWLIDTMKEREPAKGVEVRSSCDGWLHEDVQTALSWAHNAQVDRSTDE